MIFFKGQKKGIPSKSILVFIAVIVFSIFIYFQINKEPEQGQLNPVVQNSDIVDGIHQPTGLKEDQGLMTVVAHCTACHSAQLVIQNRMNKERWNATIRWMQETQNLWDLGDNQEIIVDYLVRNYPVSNKGRRQKLNNIEWYKLNDK